MSKYKISFISLTSIILLAVAISLTLFICMPNKTYATAEEQLELSFTISQDGQYTFTCNNVKNWQETNPNKKLLSEIENYMSKNYPKNYFDLIDYIKSRKRENLYQNDFTISYQYFTQSFDATTLATSADVKMYNEIIRQPEFDDNGYFGYHCTSYCEWAKAPINRYKDILALTIVSNTTPIYEFPYGVLHCYSNSGPVMYDSISDPKKVREYSLPGSIGFMMDLPLDVLIGGIYYKKFELEVSADVSVKESFNMNSAYAHRILVGSPVLSFDKQGSFAVNLGTDLFTKTSAQFL